ncbi:MAG TPA: hypothetical protein VGB52_01655 [Actinomycetota bacterium]
MERLPRPGLPPEQRWPPLALGVVAVIMIFTVFPNPLRPPPQNPNAQAEYAAGPPDTPNFNESALATSGGVGSTHIEYQDPVALAAQAPPPPPQFRARTKECVGTPPRQTEDPLSPPCVGWFDGVTSATYRGVTRDEIRVLFYNDWDVEGDLTGPYDSSQEPNGSFNVARAEGLVKTIKAQLRFFQERFQTYGRRVLLIGVKSQGRGSTCPQRRGDASFWAGQLDPFAALDFSFANPTCFLDEIASVQKVMTFGINPDLPPGVYQRNKPLIFGFYPDQGSEAAWSADFACNLAAKRATWAGDTDLRTKRRTFALIQPNEPDQAFGEDRITKRLRDELQARCNLSYREISSGGIRQAAQEGITTIICQCNPGTARNAQDTADSEDYHPEWFFPYGSGMLSNAANRAAASPTQRSFGMTHHWLLPSVQEQFHYRAYMTQEQGSRPNTDINFEIYMQFMNLFTGIQAAGPKLTPESVQKGMFTFQYQNQQDPSQPTGGYGPYSPKAVSDYTFIDTVALWWWNPDGTEPGGEQGCLALTSEGRRYYLGEWPADPGFFDPETSRCTADPESGGGGGFDAF